MLSPTQVAFAALDTIGSLSGRVALWVSPERVFMTELLRCLAPKSGDRVLDVGCGSGDLLAMAATLEPGAFLVGIDPDEDALEMASHKISGTLHAAELHQGVAQQLPFDDESFDAACATRLLGGLEARDRAEALAECWRVLRPGGRLIVADWVEEPRGLEALLHWPWRTLAETFLSGRGGTPSIADAISIARFHPAEPRGTFRTVVGQIELLEAFKPLQR